VLTPPAPRYAFSMNQSSTSGRSGRKYGRRLHARGTIPPQLPVNGGVPHLVRENNHREKSQTSWLTIQGCGPIKQYIHYR